jgi:hypothetical protein
MKKIWILIVGILTAYIAIVSIINNDDLSRIYYFPLSNWIYRLLLFAASIGAFIEYYKANWWKPGKNA